MKPHSLFQHLYATTVVVVLFTFFSSIVKSQPTALGQLESMAGRSIGSTYVPAPSAQSSGNLSFKNPFEKTSAEKLSEARDHYQKALQEFNKKDWTEAIRLLRKALRKDPYNANYNSKLKEAEDARDKERNDNKYLENEKIAAKEQQNKMKEIEAFYKKQNALKEKRIQQEQAAIQQKINKEINEAEKLIKTLKKDISKAQLKLKNYSLALNNNNSELEKWASQVDESYNSVLDNSKGYVTSMFIKYNLMQGVLKKHYVNAVYKRMGNLWKSSNPDIQKWLARELKKVDLRMDEVQGIVDKLSEVSEQSDIGETLIYDDKDKTGKTLELLLYVNGLLESSGLNSYDSLLKANDKLFGAAAAMPSEYFDQAKMIGETYSELSAICYSWFAIRKLNLGNEKMAKEVNIISAGMEQRMTEVGCLKGCLKNYTNRCLENCTGKTKWSTPPPPLLFEPGKW